jgi:PEGA domain
MGSGLSLLGAGPGSAFVSRLVAAAVLSVGIAAPGPASAEPGGPGDRPRVAQEDTSAKPRAKKGKKSRSKSRRSRSRSKKASERKQAKPQRTKAEREADRHFKTGVALFEERKYAEALAEFEQAYALKPHPLVLNNLAAAHRALSQYDQAVDFYNRFLIEGEGKLAEAELVRVRGELDDLLRQVARVEVITSPEGAAVQVDGRSTGETPLDEPLILGPGDHTVDARLAGHEPAQRKIRVAAGDTLRVEFDLEEEKTEVVADVPDEVEPDEPDVTVTAPAPPPPPELRRFGMSASYGANALEVSETGAPVVGLGFAITSRFSIGVDVVVTALAAAPALRYRIFGDAVSVHAVAAAPVTFRDGGESSTFAAGAGGLGLRIQAGAALALRLETWVSYAGSEHGTTVPTFAGAEVWF